jgi:dinuclear metal center YbgI/SA1388 family protein
MEKLDTVVKFLDRYLEVHTIKDSSWNGLQHEGKSDVRRVLFAADAGIETFEKAVDLDADLVVVHHGIFWKSTSPCLVGWFKNRVTILCRHGISLYAVHLPLDRHRVVGNNAQLVKLLGARIRSGFCEMDGKNVGWIGDFKHPVPLKEIEQKLSEGLNTQCTVLPFGKRRIKSVAVLSGGGTGGHLQEAARSGVDLYLTGEVSDIYHTAKDMSINVIFGGHHATEILGVKALSELVRKKFKVKTVFADIPTGL